MKPRLAVLPSVQRAKKVRRVTEAQPVTYPVAAEIAYVASLHQLATQNTNLMHVRILPRLRGVLENAGPKLPRIDDRSERLASLMAEVKGVFGVAQKTARKAADMMIAMVSGQHAQEFGDKYRGLIKVNPMVGEEKWLPYAMQLATERNVALIDSIPTQLRKDAERVITDGVMAQRTAAQLADELIERCGVMESRAILIARDQTSKWHGELQRLRQIDAGCVAYTWSTSRDERVRRSHQMREGQRYRWDTPPSGGDHPGLEVMCLPGTAHVANLGEVAKAFCRRHHGPICVIRTDAGPAARCTPNHPVLTGRGWIPAQDVQVGDDVWQALPDQADLLHPDEHRVQPTAHDYFCALRMAGASAVVPAVGCEFHGDALVDEQIEVVTLDWSLTAHGKPGRLQEAAKLLLERADVCLPDSPRARYLHPLFERLLSSSARSVRGFSKALALLCGGVGHPLEHRGAARAWLDTPALQLVCDGCALDAEALRQAFDTLAAQKVSHHPRAVDLFRVVRWAVHDPAKVRGHASSAERLAEIVRMDVQDLRHGHDPAVLREKPLRVVEKLICVDSGSAGGGHVYNFETRHGWYTTEGLVVHNCRCAALPILDEDDEQEPQPETSTTGGILNPLWHWAKR